MMADVPPTVLFISQNCLTFRTFPCLFVRMIYHNVLIEFLLVAEDFSACALVIILGDTSLRRFVQFSCVFCSSLLPLSITLLLLPFRWCELQHGRRVFARVFGRRRRRNRPRNRNLFGKFCLYCCAGCEACPGQVTFPLPP